MPPAGPAFAGVEGGAALEGEAKSAYAALCADNSAFFWGNILLSAGACCLFTTGGLVGLVRDWRWGLKGAAAGAAVARGGARFCAGVEGVGDLGV